MTPAGLPNQGSLPNTARRALQQRISWTASLNVKKRTMNASTIPADACRHPPHRSRPEPALINIFLLAISHVADGTSSGSCRTLDSGKPTPRTPPTSPRRGCSAVVTGRTVAGRPTSSVGAGEHVNLSVARCVCRWISPGYAPASGGHWTGLRSHIVRRWAAQPSVEQTALFSHRRPATSRVSVHGECPRGQIDPKLRNAPTSD